ncbi:MAG: FliM/FliN family flagellar motor switch protein [Hyphomonadaceae bacterium]|nr:FliM/FliN family flagellar motor switch protein [Hyphomonadaceae bacterium]
MLQKKIEMSSGLPPSILELRAFWVQLTDTVAGWTSETFDIHARPEICLRKVLSSKDAHDLIETQFASCFLANASPGLACIALDESAATSTAAARLHQPRESLADTSSLFLKLMCEQPCGALWSLLAAVLPGHDYEAEEPPVCEASMVVGGFEQGNRYLLIGMQIEPPDAPGRISLLFDLDYLLKAARQFCKQAVSSAGGQVSAQGRDRLRESVRGSMVTLDAVMERLSLTVGECSRLEVGQILPLPEVDAEHLCLSAETVNGPVDIGQAQLGVWKQQRAMKLNTPIIESFTRNLVDL